MNPTKAVDRLASGSVMEILALMLVATVGAIIALHRQNNKLKDKLLDVTREMSKELRELTTQMNTGTMPRQKLHDLAMEMGGWFCVGRVKTSRNSAGNYGRKQHVFDRRQRGGTALGRNGLALFLQARCRQCCL